MRDKRSFVNFPLSTCDKRSFVNSLVDLSFVEVDYAVGHFAYEFGVVGDYEHHLAVACQSAQQFGNLLHVHQVQAACGLVEDEHGVFRLTKGQLLSTFIN